MDELEFCVDLEKFEDRDAGIEDLFRQDPGIAFALSLPDLFVLRDRVEGAELHVVQIAINDKRELAIALKRAKMRKDWTADFDKVGK
jgi:hypothetical protein